MIEPLETVSSVPFVFELRLSPWRTFTPVVNTVASFMESDSYTSSHESAKPPPIAPTTALMMPICFTSVLYLMKTSRFTDKIPFYCKPKIPALQSIIRPKGGELLFFVGHSRRRLRFTLQGRIEHNRIRHIIYHAAMRAHHVLKTERNSQWRLTGRTGRLKERPGVCGHRGKSPQNSKVNIRARERYTLTQKRYFNA